MRLALKGDQVAAVVCVDLKRAIHIDKVLTFKQRRYLNLWWEGYTTIDIAARYSVSHVTVINTIARSFRGISSYLSKKVTICPMRGTLLMEGDIY